MDQKDIRAIIYSARPAAKRIKFFIPYQAHVWRAMIKSMNSSFYHHEQKLWSVINTKENLIALKKIFGEKHKIVPIEKKNKLPSKELSNEAVRMLEAVEQALCLKAYSPNTFRSYRAELINFFVFFDNRKISSLTKEEIEAFVYHLKSKYRISDSRQNVLINAIKFLYEKVLHKPREYYNIQRPKKSQSLPNILSKKEILDLLTATKNIKHKAILATIYSAGLRLQEVINLRIEDIHKDNQYLFIKAAKGKKDRRSVLSSTLTILLEKYLDKYKPSYWLFEGIDGHQYSASSVQKIFRKAVKESNVNPWATPHTLRHSFATHLLQQGINLRYVQALLGHSSSKTTEIYTHVMNINNKIIESPLDSILNERIVS